MCATILNPPLSTRDTAMATQHLNDVRNTLGLVCVRENCAPLAATSPRRALGDRSSLTRRIVERCSVLSRPSDPRYDAQSPVSRHAGHTAYGWVDAPLPLTH